MRKLTLLILVCLCCAVASQPWAATADWQTQQNVQGVETYFAVLKQAYETKDLNLFLNCFDAVVPSTDVTRNENLIYTEAMMREELTMLFAMVDQIQIDFMDLQIIVDRDTAMAKTLRRGAATGFPVAYVTMVFSLQKGNNGWGNQDWKIVNQVLVDEWYDFSTIGTDQSTQTTPQDTNGKKIGKKKKSFLF